MNYILNPSLEHICLTKIATQLLTVDDEIIASIENHCSAFHPYESKVFVNMREKVKNLQLPTSCIFKLLSFIWPISKQIFQWHRYLYRKYDLTINAKEVRWTSYGTIDKTKTVKLLFQREQSLSLKQRYRLACTFCLVDKVQALLQKEMPDEEKLPVLAYSSLVQTDEQDLVVYFTQHVPNCYRYFRRRPVAYLSPYHEACHVAILSCNPTATKYLFQKLSPEEKNNILLLLQVDFGDGGYNSRFPCEFFAELVSFLLSQMSETQQVEMMRSCASCVFESVIVWPYNRAFLLATANRVWSFLRGRDFEHLLNCIFSNIGKYNGEGGYGEYQEMYFEMWRMSPDRCRSYFLNHLRITNLYLYFNMGGMEVCKLVLSEANAALKERLILDERWFGYFRYDSPKRLWNFFEFFIKECGISIETIVRLKSRLTTHDLRVNNNKIAQFIQFLDNFHPDVNRN